MGSVRFPELNYHPQFVARVSLACVPTAGDSLAKKEPVVLFDNSSAELLTSVQINGEVRRIAVAGNGIS
jgi:hypothetical protein